MEIRLDFKDVTGPSPGAGFNTIAGNATYPDLFDSETESTGINAIFAGAGTGNTISFGGANPPTGDAAWVPVGVSGTARRIATSPNWATLTFTGALDPTKVYRWELYGVASSGSATITCRVNGGASQVLEIAQNQSETLVFENLSVVGGEIVVEMMGSVADAYIGAGRLMDMESTAPRITLDGAGTLSPGNTISGSYTNFGGAPTGPLTLTDSNDNTLNVTVTISDNGDGSGTFTGTLPSLPAQGNSAAGLLFGTVTAELTDPGA